jgi:hypothetical protein
MQANNGRGGLGFVVTRFHDGISWVLTDIIGDNGRRLWSNMSDDAKHFSNKGLASIACKGIDSLTDCERWNAKPVIMKYFDYLDLFTDECVSFADDVRECVYDDTHIPDYQHTDMILKHEDWECPYNGI